MTDNNFDTVILQRCLCSEVFLNVLLNVIISLSVFWNIRNVLRTVFGDRIEKLTGGL
jgi:hypothetical protein